MVSTHTGTQRVQSRYRLLDVRAVERITPRMTRVTLGGSELSDFVSSGSDQRIKLCLPQPGNPTPLGRSRAEVFALPREQQPKQRTYTVRRFDPDALELTVDLVVHDHECPGSVWAANVAPGDRIVTVGPSPSYQVGPDADPLVLIGDETALPAIGAIVEELPEGRSARAVVEVADAAEEQRIDSAADVEWTWLHRDGAAPGSPEPLMSAVRELHTGPNPHVWIGAEATPVREVRDHFEKVLGLERSRVYALAYWRKDRAGT